MEGCKPVILRLKEGETKHSSCLQLKGGEGGEEGRGGEGRGGEGRGGEGRGGEGRGGEGKDEPGMSPRVL